MQCQLKKDSKTKTDSINTKTIQKYGIIQLYCRSESFWIAGFFLFFGFFKRLHLALANSANHCIYIFNSFLRKTMILSAPGPKHWHCRWSHIPWVLSTTWSYSPSWEYSSWMIKPFAQTCYNGLNMFLTNSTQLYCSVKIWLSLKL